MHLVQKHCERNMYLNHTDTLYAVMLKRRLWYRIKLHWVWLGLEIYPSAGLISHWASIDRRSCLFDGHMLQPSGKPL